MTVTALDHLVLTVADMDATLHFYCDVLGMVRDSFAAGDGTERIAVSFGSQKINLHPVQTTIQPRAAVPTPGSADLCFLTEVPLADWQEHLGRHGIEVEDGPVARTGATGPLTSIYVRDPDGNLIEVSVRG